MHYFIVCPTTAYRYFRMLIRRQVYRALKCAHYYTQICSGWRTNTSKYPLPKSTHLLVLFRLFTQSNLDLIDPKTLSYPSNKSKMEVIPHSGQILGIALTRCFTVY